MIDSDFFVFQSLVVGGTISKFIRLTLSYDLGLNRVKYGLLAGSLLVVVVISLNPLFSLLRWLLGFLYLSNFLGVHAFTPACDTIKGYEKIDSNFAIISTLLAYLLLPNFIFVLSKILVPFESDETLKFVEEASKKNLILSDFSNNEEGGLLT